jgi:regulator of protease activity HflC (stomatin/prohibitin superfamily)
MLYTKIKIRDGEVGLMTRQGRFVRFLAPGIYRLPTPMQDIEVDTLDTTGVAVQDETLMVLARTQPEAVAAYFVDVATSDTQVALVFQDGILKDFVPPGTRAFYGRALADITVETVAAVEGAELPRDLVPALVGVGLKGLVELATVRDYQAALLFVQGRLVRELEPGLYAFLKPAGLVEVRYFDRRQQVMEVGGQEILTKDRVTLRLNVTVLYRITDPVAAVTKTVDPSEYLYKEAQLALREALGPLTLDEVLAEKVDLDQRLRARLTERAAAVGVTLDSLGVKDVILPGEMRELMNRVLEAEKMAQANLIRRREETAATRSLLNTAKLMEGNPVLLRLKEIEALERVVEKVDRLTVNQGLEGVMTDLVRIKPAGKD